MNLRYAFFMHPYFHGWISWMDFHFEKLSHSEATNVRCAVNVIWAGSLGTHLLITICSCCKCKSEVTRMQCMNTFLCTCILENLCFHLNLYTNKSYCSYVPTKITKSPLAMVFVRTRTWTLDKTSMSAMASTPIVACAPTLASSQCWLTTCCWYFLKRSLHTPYS